MESLYLLIPIALIFCVIAIRLLLWAIDSGQYDDLDKEGWRILADDPPPRTHGEPQVPRAPTGPAEAQNTPGRAADPEPTSTPPAQEPRQ